MARLISYAFRVPPYRVTGPTWLDDGQRFDIEATFHGTPENQVPEMLQALLKDRFGLVVHEGTVDQEVFALIVDKAGLKLKEASPTPATEPPANDSTPGATFLLGGIQTVRTEILTPKTARERLSEQTLASEPQGKLKTRTTCFTSKRQTPRSRV